MYRLLLVACGALADHAGFSKRGAEGRRLYPAAVDPFAVGAGGFACPVSTGGGAGSATVVWAAAASAGGALALIDSTLETCEKPPAASLAPGGQPPLASINEGLAIFERATSMVAAMVLN